ncbi:MAG: hypothetical protein ACHREM_08785 [Polyangiales bacterium]
MLDTDFERDDLIRAGAPVATLMRDQNFVVVELVRRVREEAEQLPFVLSAWVRPDGRRYVMTGIGDLDSYERAAEASTRIYREFTPRLGIDFDDDFSLSGRSVCEKWIHAFERGEA